VTGAPVIELGYKLFRQYLKRLIWRHIDELGWHRDRISPPRLERLGGGIFLLPLKSFLAALKREGWMLEKIAGRNA
jgi:hypothetical protein